MWFNPIMEWVLKSPLHSLISNTTMIIYFSGCKSGKPYHTPVGYQRENDTLLTVSWKTRTWWRNLRQGCDVKVLLKGKLVEAYSQVFEDETMVGAGLAQFIGANPRAARMFKVEMNDRGQLDPESLKQATRDKVFIRTTMK